MSQKLKKIKCNLTGKVIQIYEDYYKKKVEQYGSEELLEKFYIQKKIISLIKNGQDINAISNLFNFEICEDKIPYYKELINFHTKNKYLNLNKDNLISFDETDENVKKFINNWIEYNLKNVKHVYCSGV